MNIRNLLLITICIYVLGFISGFGYQKLNDTQLNELQQKLKKKIVGIPRLNNVFQDFLTEAEGWRFQIEQNNKRISRGAVPNPNLINEAREKLQGIISDRIAYEEQPNYLGDLGLANHFKPQFQSIKEVDMRAIDQMIVDIQNVIDKIAKAQEARNKSDAMIEMKPSSTKSERDKSMELRKAVYSKQLDKAKELLKSGANPNVLHSNTPLWQAVFNDDEQMVHLLLEYKADPNQENNPGHPGITPLWQAVKQQQVKFKNAKIIELLQKAGAKKTPAVDDLVRERFTNAELKNFFK